MVKQFGKYSRFDFLKRGEREHPEHGAAGTCQLA